MKTLSVFIETVTDKCHAHPDDPLPHLGSKYRLGANPSSVSLDAAMLDDTLNQLQILHLIMSHCTNRQAYRKYQNKRLTFNI